MALILLLPVQVGIRKLIDGEPYPGLFLPNFGPVLGNSSAVNFELAEIVGVLSNGVRVSLDPDNIMPTPAGYSVTVARILSDPAKSSADDTKSWLRERLAATYPDLDITSVSVVWSQWSYDATTGQRTVVATTDSNDIVLGGPR
jgi:type III secretory pathway lipoprotein EscJ